MNVRPPYVKAILMDLIGSIRAETVLPLQGGREPSSVVSSVVEAANQVIRLAQIEPGRVLGVGVGCPGPVADGRTLVGIPGFPWENEPLADQLERRLGLPVILDNNANCGALAEFRHGACSRDQDCASMVFMYVDYGIGAGIVLDGAVYRGADGTAGEIGHTTINPDGPLCLCGNFGCLEAVASVESLVRRSVTTSRPGEESQAVALRDGDWESVSFEAVMEAVEEKDEFASSALDDALDYLAVGVSNLSRMFRPNLIVLGGYMFERSDEPFKRLKEIVETRPSLFGMKPLNLAVGELGSTACGVGAATLILENFFGVAHHVMAPTQTPQLTEPAFESALVWPQESEQSVLVTTSPVEISWAGNLDPTFSRIRTGDHLSVTVDVRVAEGQTELPTDLAVLLHWDRVALFGGNWATPKNSPMRFLEEVNGVLRYEVRLGSLPSGRYEFAAHVIGKNDVWVRTNDERGERNGRVEVLRSRATADRPEDQDTDPLSGKEAERPEALVQR